MPRAAKACGGCGQPTITSPCPACTPSRPRYLYPRANHTKSAAARGYDHHWRKLRDRALKRQPWCAHCGTTEDLTGDHHVPLREDPTRRLDPTNVVILCRTCNSRKG